MLFLALLIGGWGVVRYRLHRAEAVLQGQAQTILDLERAALLNGDGDLFFASQTKEPAWFAAQLHPRTQARYRAGFTVTQARQAGDAVWANVAWTEEAQTHQQIMFFQWVDGRLQHAQTAPAYWGSPARRLSDWGELLYWEADQNFAPAIERFITHTLAALCPDNCLAEQPPLTVAVTWDSADTVTPQRLHIPSPRLLGLNAAGQPADLFWQELRRRLENHLAPATIIRFAVPPLMEQLVDYQTAARHFMAANPHITIEIITLDAPTAGDLLAYDAAAFPLSEAMLASGGVQDLTDYAQADPDFAQADFYEQMWQGAWWQGRLWFVPHTAAMNVLFYDKAAYRAAQYPEPSPRWTWEEMAQEMLLIADPDAQNRPQWGFLDAGNDALFSYAYNWENRCTAAAAVQCNRPLTETAVVAALAWYQQMAGQPGQMPNLTQIPAREQENVLLNWQSARRRAAIWVDTPLNYEFRLLLGPLGVVPFPGSNRFNGITPLRVHGFFISQEAGNPRAAWQWLKFLSFQPPIPTFRHVPARPSIAETSGYWQLLPRELGNSMRIAFPFARPVTLAEQRYFTNEQVTAVLTGAPSAQAVHITPSISWFQDLSNPLPLPASP